MRRPAPATREECERYRVAREYLESLGYICSVGSFSDDGALSLVIHDAALLAMVRERYPGLDVRVERPLRLWLGPHPCTSMGSSPSTTRR
jgi:hypothetical protein